MIETLEHLSRRWRSALVQRFHVHGFASAASTVGTHSHRVAILVDWVYHGAPSATLLRAALFHDAPELYTGDVPAPAKWQYPQLKAVLIPIEKEILESKFALPKLRSCLTDEEQVVLRYCDSLDFMWECRYLEACGVYDAARLFLVLLEKLQGNDHSFIKEADRLKLSNAAMAKLYEIFNHINTRSINP